MIDIYRQQLELNKIFEEAAGIRNLRMVEDEIRKIIEPFRTPYVSMMESFTENATGRRALEETFLRATAPFSIPPSVEQALAATFPESVRGFFDHTADQRRVDARPLR